MGYNIVYGAHKDHDNAGTRKAARYYAPKIAYDDIPEQGDGEKYICKAENQFQVGRCTGEGFGGACSAVAARLGLIPGGARMYYSPDWLYNGARSIEGTLLQDAGAYPNDVAQWIVDRGLALYGAWPPTEKFDTTDPFTKLALAILYDNRQMQRITGAKNIMCALAEGHFVAIGIPFPVAWESYSSGVLPMPMASSILAGGHEMWLYDWRKSKGTVLGLNSWGTNWGIDVPFLGTRGGFEMPAESFSIFSDSLGGYDAHILIFDASVPAVQCALAIIARCISHTPNDIGGKATGAGAYPYGTKVALAATPNSGHKFSQWTPITGLDDYTKALASIVLSGDTTLYANFTEAAKQPCNCGTNVAKGLTKAARLFGAHHDFKYV